jgi:hypothetical protein
MPYRLRLFSGEQLLVSTDEETTELIGRRIAEFPPAELSRAGEPGGVRHEVVYLEEDGEERPATDDENKEVFQALMKRLAEVAEGEVAPCPRCGRKVTEHEQPYPAKLTPEGMIAFECLTDEERERMPAES